MLRELKVDNYAIIGHLDIGFHRDLNTITGETGAGKSILLGALSLLSGGRADASVIRDGAANCVIEAVFEIAAYKENLLLVFEENDLDWENTITVRRMIAMTGKSRAFINDIPVTLATLKSVADRLIDIHSQHQTLLLAGTGFQTHLVDAVAGHLPLTTDYAAHYKQLHALKGDLTKAVAATETATKERDYMQYQLDQLLALKLRVGETAELEAELNLLTHAEEIATALDYCATAMTADADQGGVNATIKNMLSQLGKLKEKYPASIELAGRMESTYLELKDLAEECGNRRDNVEINPQRLATATLRLDTIYALCQKHRLSADATADASLLELQRELDVKLQSFDAAEEHIVSLRKEIAELEAEAEKEAKKITAGRMKAGPKIAKHVVSTLSELGIKGAVFEVSITPSPEGRLTQTGHDVVAMRFSGNAGTTPQPIENVASGGEMSRVMLALKGLVARSMQLPTIIFDEIDTGVSGHVADKMGDIITELGNSMQVLNITHLPQVAAKGEHHFYVYKDSAERAGSDDSGTHIRELTPMEREEHIAAMLSGSAVTEAARVQARELLKRS